MTDLKLNVPVVTAGNPTLVRAVVHNYGPSKAEGVGVRLIVDGILGPVQTVDLPVGEDQPVVFNQTFSSPATISSKSRSTPTR